jgi:hypothetical protein
LRVEFVELVGRRDTWKHVSPSVLVFPAGHVSHASAPDLILYLPVAHIAQLGRAVFTHSSTPTHTEHDAHAPSVEQVDGKSL